jgi:hypothetical protein
MIWGQVDDRVPYAAGRELPVLKPGSKFPDDEAKSMCSEGISSIPQ